MVKKFFIFILFSLLAILPLAAAETDYYVLEGGAGLADCSSKTDACDADDIPWSTIISTDLPANDVTVWYKYGETYDTDQILGSTPTSNTNRLYIKGDPTWGTGDKPHITRTGGYYLMQLDENSNVTFENLKFSYQGTANTGSRGIDIQDDDNDQKGGIHVVNCDFSNIERYAVDFHGVGDRCVAYGNTFTDCGNGIYFNEDPGDIDPGDYHYIAENTCTRMNWGEAFGSADGHCVSLRMTNYTIIENNTATDCRAAFILFVETSDSATDVLFRGNTVDGCELVGIDIYHENTSGDSSSERIYVYQNIVKDWGEDDVSSARPAIRDNSFKGSGGVHIFNNTIYNTGSGEWGIQNRRSVDYSDIFNNIVVTGARGSDDDLIYHATDGGTFGSNLTFDYNLYWTIAGDPSSYTLWTDSNTTAYDWSDWTTSRSNDTNSPSPANPNFIDTTDFELNSGSDAIDNGMFIATINQTNGSGTSFTVDSAFRLHHDWNVTDHNGSAVDGMLISLYDATNGVQNTEITNISGTTVTVADSVSWIQDTTKIGLRIYGTAPDIGAVEYEPAAATPANLIILIIN